MDKKKILMVGPFPPTVGGITTCMINILKSSLNKKFNFIPFTTSRPTIGIMKNVIDYNLLFNIGFKNLFKSALVTLYHLFQFPFILLTRTPKIIHINTTDYWQFWESSIYVLVSKLLFKKIILHIHATAFQEFYDDGNFFTKFFIKKVLLLSDRVIILSPKQKNLYTKFLPEEKLSVISNVTNFKKFQNSSINVPEELKSEEFVKVLFIGGEEAKRKGIYDVIDSIPLVVEKYGGKILFIFLGRYDINKISELTKIKKISKHVKFLGYVEEKDKIKIMKTSDIFILPSYAEGLPITMLEAMASGLPVISTPVGSIPEVIMDNINGFLIQPGDYDSLAEKIIYLASNSKLRRDIGRNNREIINKKYDIKVLTNKMASLYDEL